MRGGSKGGASASSAAGSSAAAGGGGDNNDDDGAENDDEKSKPLPKRMIQLNVQRKGMAKPMPLKMRCVSRRLPAV